MDCATPTPHRRTYSNRGRVLVAFLYGEGAKRAGGCHRLRWWRVALALIFSSAAAYAALACGVFVVVRYYHGVVEARLVDAAFPPRWPRFVAAQGHHLIVRATNHARRGERREALICLRSGLAKFPSHRAGRLLLARLEVASGRTDAARQTLLDGVRLHPRDVVYLNALFSFLLERHYDYEVISLARRLLPSAATGAAHERVIALAAATAGFNRGNYNQAEAFLRAVPHLDSSAAARLLSAKIDWELGHRAIALLRMRSLADAAPDQPALQQELITYLRQSGLHEEARRRTIELQLAHPHLPAARLSCLRFYYEAGEVERLTREIEAYLRDFPDEAALVALAEFAANAGDPALARRLRDEAASRGVAAEAHAFLHVEALLAARDYRSALDGLRELRGSPAAGSRHATLSDSLHAVAYQGLGETETARVFVNNFLLQPGLRAEHLLRVANHFDALGASEVAHQILQRAVAIDSHNQAALTRLIELQLNLNRLEELPGYLRRLLRMRKPSPDVLRVAHYKLGSDVFPISPDLPALLEQLRDAVEQTERPRPRS